MANNPLFGGASMQDIRKDIETRTQQSAQQPTQQQPVSQRSVQRGFSSGSSMNGIKNDISTRVNTVQTAVPVPAPAQKSAYQQTVSQPIAPQQKPITTRDIMGKMYTTMQQDQSLGLQMQNDFAKLQQNPQSQFYAPYMQPTSMAMKDLAEIGFDTSVLNDDWMEANQGWILDNLIYNGTTTTPSKPGKKATWDQRAAYDLYQYGQDEEATKKFEQQYEAAKEEVAYWAGRTDLNLSPEEIMERVGWDKYDMLSKADEGKKSGRLVELNRGTDYSQDAFYGVIWATRNGGSTGSVWQDMARSAIGDGNQWKEDPEIAAKLNWNDKNTYAPYQVGMTANDVGLYFGVQKMTRADLDGIRRTIDPSDATAMKMYEAAEAAVSNTEQGQSEVKLFQDTLNERLKNCTDPEKAVQEVMKLYNNGVYDKNTKETTSFSMLHKLDDSLNGSPDDLVKTTDAIDWRLEDVKEYARSVAEANSKKKNGSTVISDTSSKIQNDVQASAGDGSEGTGLNIPTPTAAEAETKKAQDETLSSAASALEDNVTPAEQATIENGWSITFDDVVRMWDGLTATASDMGEQAVGMVKQVAGSLADGAKQQVMNDHMNKTLSSIQDIYEYETTAQAIAAKQAELDQLEKSGVLAYVDMEVRPNMEKEVTIDGTTYMVGLEYVPGADDASGNYQLAYIDELNQYGDRFGVMDMEYWRNLSNNEGVLAAIGEANKEAEKINQAKEYSANASEEDLEKAKRLRQLQLEIEDLKARNAENKGIYEEANAKFEAAQSRREQSLYWMRFLGMDTSDFEKEDYTLQYLADFADYEATAWSRYNPSDAYRIAIAEGYDRNQIYETAKKGNDELSEELQLAKAVRSYIDENNLAVPENYITNLDRHIAKLERDQKDFEYFALSMNDDFKAVAEKGREIEYKNATTGNLRMPWSQEEYYRRAEDPNDDSKVFGYYGLRGLTQGLYEQLTEDEKDTYYYLLGKGDKEGAADYIQSLMDSSYGVLHTRYTEDLKKNAAEMTGSGVLGFVGANILSVLASPISSIASLGYGIYSLATGKELNPNNAILFANNFKTTTREQSQEEIAKSLKDAPPIATSLVQGFYEIVTNRLDSMTNGLAFGGLSSNISNSILNELVGASPMGFSAAMDSMMEVKRNGGSDAQAWTIGLVTFLAETGTEAVSLDNIKDAFGIGKEAAQGGVGAFVKNWLTKAGVSEMLGETATEIIEQKINEAVMGENSDHSNLVWSYRMKGYGPDDAEAMARRDEIGNILHTALISYLSPGADIMSYAAGRGAYYLEKTRKAQHEGYNTNIFEVYGIERAADKARKEQENKAAEREPGQINLDAVDEANERHAQRDAEEAVRQNGVANGEGSFVFVGGENAVQEEQIDPETFKEIENRYGNRQANDTSAEAAKDYNALETVRGADNSTKTATASHVMNTERTDASADKATAAAKAFNRALGNDTNMVDFLQDAVIGADVGGTDRGAVMDGIQTAVLGGEDSASFKVMQTEAFKTATPAGKAVMLAQAAEQDRQNKTVQDTIAKNVHDSRVAEAEKPLIANGALDGTKKAADARDSAITDLNTARTELQKKTAEKEAKGQAMANAAAELNQNPSDENRKNMDRALNELNGAITAEDQYAQNVDNMQEKADKAQQDLNDVRNREMTALRQQAEARVAEIDQERAQFAEQQRVLNEAREKAIAKAREDENFSRLNAEEVVDELFPNISEDDRKYALGMVMAVQRATSQDANSWLARGNFAKSFAKKFNLQWQTVQNAPYNARVNPKTGTLEVSSEATQSDIMYAILIHELTHIAEASDTYGELADAVLQIKYGDGVTYKGILDAMKSGDVSSKLAQDVLGKKSIYDRQLNKNHSNEEMLQEIVADCVGYTISEDQQALDRLVAEKPSLVRRIIESIKSFLRKAVGLEDETLTQAQQIVDKLEKALTLKNNNGGTKYSLVPYSDSERMNWRRSNKITIYDGNPETIDRFINFSLDHKDQFVKLYFGKIDPILAARIRAETGLETEGLNLALRSNEIVKIMDHSHGSYFKEIQRGQAPITANEIEEAVQTIENPDSIQRDIYTENGKDHDAVKFEKEIGGKVNAFTYIITKKHDLAIQTIYKNVKKESVAPEGDAIASPQTSETSRGTASTQRVPRDKGAVKTLVTDAQGRPMSSVFRGGTVALETNERYSLNSFTEEEQKKVRDALVKSGRFTGAQVDQYMNDALGIAAVIAADRGRLDFEASDNQVFLKPNNDYYFTLDASTLCAKRLLYQGTFDYVQHALPDEVFTPEDLIDLVNIMSDMGYETPCGICYVESRRRWLDTYAQKFLDELPDSADAFIEKYFKKATDEEKAEIREHYTEWSPSIDDLTTSDGLEQLRHNNPYMHKAFVDAMNKKGTANPKVVQLRTEYRGDIRDMKAKEIQKVKDIGGLRIQSFSDFETPHLLDMVQAVLDMSAAGLTSQAYTKVPNFAWVFGDTGIKINLSLIGKGTGLDENGNLVFDDREGMPFEEAMKLRDRYSKNVGTILVGINDDHIIAAMGDPRIDFIIPFHKSGWSSEELRKMPTLNNYNDYTNTQNERLIIGRNEDGSYVTESFKIHKDRTKESLENFQPVGKNGYWDFSKNGQWNAEKYLKMCAEQHRIPKFSQFLVDNGNGTFSLPQGSDKRSTAIREGYWKTLIDFKMYDNNGVGAAQTEVTPNVNMAEAYRVLGDYKLGRQMPDKADGTKGRFIPMESNNSVPVAIPAAEEYIELIKRKRGWSKPAAPGPDTLEADLPSNVINPRASAFGASTAPAVLGNTEGETIEANSAGQNAMAIDAETGETVRYSLPAAIDHVYEDMSTDELWELLGLDSGDEEEARNIMTVAVQDIKDEFDPTIYNGRLYVKPDTLDHWLSSGGFASSNPKYAQAYITTMNPEDFLRMTTVTEQGQNRILNEATPLDEEKIGETAMRQPIQLSIDEASGKIVGHEGRHRAVALARAGVTEIPVLLFDNATKYSKEAKPELTLRGQDYGENENGNELTFRDVIPLSSGNRDEITQRFTASAEDEASAAENDQRVLRYSLPSDAPYLSAVNHGNMNEAQKMVDEKAKEAGYDVNYLVWRGDSEPYNVLLKPSEQENYEYSDGEYGESGNLGEGLYFTPNRGYAEQFARNGGIVRKFYLKYNAADLSDADVQAELNSILRDVEESGEFASTDEIMDELLTRLDKDAIIGHDVGGFAAGADEIAVQGSWQAKLADPVTYDDDGNVIPLSERFNTRKDDIRYNLPSDNYLEEMIRQRLGQGNGLTEMDNLPGMPTTEDGSAQRQFGSRTAQGSNALHQSVKDYLFTHSSYTPESNQEQIDRAMSWVENKKNDSDPDGYHAALSEVLSPNFDYRSADGQARMLTVMGMAALKGDTENELRLADAYNKQGTDLGRQLQARKIFRLMTPVGRMSVLQKMVRDVNDEYGRQGKATRVGLSDWTLQAAAAAETEDDFAKVRKAAAREIAEQMPANWKDKLRGFRMLSMLGNPRTHIRNIIGNAMFIPAVSLKNKIGAAAEMITGQDSRTKTLRPFLSREVRNFAKQDALTMRDALTGEAKYNDDTMVEREKKAFRGILQVLSDFNSNALEAEDWFFLKGHYRRAFGGWMQANGYTAAQLRSDPKLLETGRAYAIQEAQKATYRDFNGLAAKLQELVRNPKTAGQKALAFGVEAALPFKKTPANILKRGIEYSPIGIAKTLVSDAKGLKQYMDYQNGKLKVMPEGAVSPNQFIDNLCAGLTGTGIMAIGALLGSMGAASAGLGDDDDELEKLKGNQEYAIKFNLFGQDVTFTMDWAAPMSMPFFVGVALQKELSSDGDMSIEDVLNAIGGISEPVFNLSMLDGVNSLFRTSQNDDTNTLTQIGTKIATNYVTSYVPSILGATARTIDTTRRKAYVESGKGTGVMGTVRYAAEQTENKIPGLSQSNIPYRDVFGRAEESGLGERILENFVLPGYLNRYDENDEVVNELSRIGAVPKMPGKTITVKKERIALTDKQWDAYVTARGQTAYNELGRLFETDAYQMADTEAKNDMVQKVWSYADQIGKNAAVPEYEVKESDPVQAGINDANKATMIRCLKDGDIEGYETMVEALREAGVEDQTIKKKIGDTYRDLYKDAYRKEDYAKMDEIENLLENTGFVFDIGSWEKAVDKEDVSGRRIDPNLLFAGAGGIPAGLSGRMMRNENTVEGPDGPIQVLGNIDLNNRQVVHNDDGSISTERSLSFYDEDTGKEVLIPTVINGRIVGDDEAIDHYYETGEYLGMFDTPEEADEYAEMLHNRQDWYYNR